MKNQFFIVFALLVLSMPVVFGQEHDGFYQGTPQGNPEKDSSESFDNSGDENWLEAQPVADVIILENGEMEPIIRGNDFTETYEDSSNDTCANADNDIYNYIFKSKISQNGDIDWYRGYKSGTNDIRFVMQPPNYKDYDFKVYDTCDESSLRATCDRRVHGGMEKCWAEDVTDYFYVKVYGYGGGYSSTEPYYISSSNDTTQGCAFSLGDGRPDKGMYDCDDTIEVTNTITNQSGQNLSVMFYQDLWYPSLLYHWTDYGPDPFNMGSGSINRTGWFDPPDNQWPENGSHEERSFPFVMCSSSKIMNAWSDISTPNVSCTPCQDECSYSGQKRCDGSYSETCGDYDQEDSCLEWGNRQYCQNGCSNGQCNQCNSHSYSACFDNDRYWYNSCNQREGMREECGNNSYGGYFCFDGDGGGQDVYQDVTERGCQSDDCYVNSDRRKVSECGNNGCSNGQCNQCTSHDHEGCFDNDVYWYNSCNEREERKEDCRVSCEFSQGDYFCNNGCLGNFKVTVKNQQGAVEQNATVSFKRPELPDFQFAGLTNSSGQLNFSDLWTRSCGLWYELKAVTANGGDCGVRSTFIEKEGDQDGIMFTCPIVNNDNFLRVAPDGPEKIKLGQTLDLRALITDRYYNPVSSALVGVNRPYNDTPLSDTTDSQGNASFLDDRVPAGSHNFQFIASKVNYNYSEAWKRVTVDPQQSSVQVRDNIGNPVWHAKILIEENIVGYTDNEGRLTVDVNEQVNTFEARNTDDIHCGYRTIRIGEQGNFICPEMPILRVDVDTNGGYPAANVAVVIDGNFVELTNGFGYSVSPISSGNHALQIFYILGETGTLFMQERMIDINVTVNVQQFIASEKDGIKVDESSLNQEVKGMDGLFVVLGTDNNAIWWVVNVATPNDEAQNLCNCAINDMRKYSNLTQQNCIDLFTKCGEINDCTNRIRETNFEFETCSEEYSALQFEVAIDGAFLFAGKILKGVGFLAEWTGVGSRLKMFAMSETAQSIISWAKVPKQKAIELVGHLYEYRASLVSKGEQKLPKVILQILAWLRGPLSEETTIVVENIARNPTYGEEIAAKGVKLIDEFGEFSDDIIETRNYRTATLVRTPKIVDIGRWDYVAKDGAYVFLKRIDGASGDSLIAVAKESGEFTEEQLKTVFRMVRNNSDDIHFDWTIHGSEAKADFVFNLNNHEYWNELSKIKGTLEGATRFSETLVDKAKKFENAFDTDNRVIISLLDGKNIPFTDIEGRILTDWATGRLRNISAVQVFDAKEATTLTVWLPRR